MGLKFQWTRGGSWRALCMAHPTPDANCVYDRSSPATLTLVRGPNVLPWPSDEKTRANLLHFDPNSARINAALRARSIARKGNTTGTPLLHESYQGNLSRPVANDEVIDISGNIWGIGDNYHCLFNFIELNWTKSSIFCGHLSLIIVIYINLRVLWILMVKANVTVAEI